MGANRKLTHTHSQIKISLYTPRAVFFSILAQLTFEPYNYSVCVCSWRGGNVLYIVECLGTSVAAIG